MGDIVGTFAGVYTFAVAILAIIYVIADLALLLYVRLRGQSAGTVALSPLVGFGPVRTVKRIWYVHSAPAMGIPDAVARFLFIVMRATWLPAFFGVVSLFILGIAENNGPGP
jgi:hypothetical protein